MDPVMRFVKNVFPFVRVSVHVATGLRRTRRDGERRVMSMVQGRQKIGMENRDVHYTMHATSRFGYRCEKMLLRYVVSVVNTAYR